MTKQAFGPSNYVGEFDAMFTAQRQAKKSHKCSMCYKEIAPKSFYTMHAQKHSGKFWYYKICRDCFWNAWND